MNLSKLSIKYQFLLIVMIVALPAICIITYSGIQQRERNIDEAKKITKKLADDIVTEQENILASTRQLFIVLSQLHEVKNHDQAEVQALLAKILKQSAHYSNIFIADSAGAVWASAFPLTEKVSVADRRYFNNAISSGNLSSGEYHIARTSKKPTLNVAYPLRDAAGRTTDVLVAGFSLEYYRKVFNQNRLPAGASFAILDHKGIILTRAIDPEKYMGKPANAEIFRYMLAGPDEETSIGTSSVVGDNRVQTYRKIRLEGEATPYMYVRVGIPTGTLLAVANAALYKNLAIYGLFLTVAIFLSWLAGKKYIIDKVLALQRSSHCLAEGHLEVRVAHEVGGGELGELGQAFDTMAERLALREQALRESEKNYRDIFNTTHDALAVIDGSGTITEVNKASERLFGYTRDELLGSSADYLMSGKSPSSSADAKSLIERALNDGTQEFELLNKTKSEESFWAEVTISPTGDPSSRKVLAVFRDITERKEMEQMKEALLSNISHEMRTPLTSMLGFLEFVIENDLDGAQIRDYHITMFKEAVRLNEMVSNFLEMQRLKSNLYKFVFSRIDSGQLLQDIAAIFATPCSRHNIVVDVPSGLPSITGDDELLHQAFSNLLSNAIKYSPEGADVIVGARLEDTTMLFRVQDSGVGIPEESLDKIFDIFYRVDDSSTRRIAGTGLGLALVKKIVDAHKGRVWVESAMGRGSTFYVSLPLVPP